MRGSVRRIRHVTVIFFLGLLALAAPAAASCGDRPGTPDHVLVDAIPPNSIQWSWRNATGKKIEEPRMWFDMYIRDGQNRSIGRDLTGTGPFPVHYNLPRRW